MSVQATVALLNKNAAVNTSSTAIATSAKPPISKIGGTTWKDAKDNRTSLGNKSARVAELERIRSTGGGVASILSKFDRSDSNDTPKKRNTTSGILSHRSSISRSSSVKRSQKSHSINNNTSRIDAIMHDLIDMYQKAMEQQHMTKGSQYHGTTTRKVDDQSWYEHSGANKTEKGDNSCIVSLDYDDGDNKGATNSRDDKENDIRTSAEDLLIVKKQLLAMEKGAQSVFERQARDLENEKKQTRKLTEVVHKQEALVAALEGKISSAKCERDELLLLQEQVELQQLEIKDKRNLLTRLLEEREEMFKLLRSQQHYNNNNHDGSMRSTSADLPSSERFHIVHHRHLISRASSPALRQTALVRSSSGLSSRPTSPPPLTAPPRDPLPPLPKSSFRGSSASSASTSSGSFLSPTTSWSSADYAAALAPVKLPDGATAGYCGGSSDNNQQQQPVWLDYNTTTHVDVLPPTPPGTIGRQPSFKLSRKRSSSNNSSFWKGWKQRLGSRS